MKPLAQLDVVRDLFVTMGTNPFLGILVGILVTAIIQSSTASIGILQSMAFSGMVPWNAAVYIVLGQNIGTCLTAVLSSIGASKNAQAASYVHLVYNVVGAAIFCVAGIVFFSFIDPGLGASAITATNISMVHTGYNVTALILLFPFGQLILKIASKMAGIGKEKTPGVISDLPELDESILETPAYALENSSKAIMKLMELIKINLNNAIKMFMDKEYKKVGSVRLKAGDIDRLNEKINDFLTKLYHEKLNENEAAIVTAYIHIIISLQRINQRTKGFTKLTEDLSNCNMDDPYDDTSKINELYEKTIHCYDKMIEAFESLDMETIYAVMEEAELVEAMRDAYKSSHLSKAANPGYSVETGIIFAEAARHLARIAHNIKSVVETIPHENSMDEEIAEAIDRR